MKPARARGRGAAGEAEGGGGAPSPASASPSARLLIPPARGWTPRARGGTPASVPSRGSSGRLGRLRRARRELESSSGSGGGLGPSRSCDDGGGEGPSTARARSGSFASALAGARMGSASPASSPRSRGDGSPRFSLVRHNSNPFLQKPLHMSSESLPLASSPVVGGHFGSVDSTPSSATRQDSPASAQTPPLQAPPVATHGEVRRHLTLLDLVAIGVGGTLGTGIFVFAPLLCATYAGPASALCWLLSAVPALLSGFCFAELAGQIPAAGSTYAYVYASIGELPAVVAAACLSLEYVVSAGAVARGWGDKMTAWMLGGRGEAGDGGVGRWLRPPGSSFNSLAFLLCALVTMLLLGGVKESKAVTNYFTAFKVAVIMVMICTGLGLLEVRNLSPFLPAEFGFGGLFYGGTVSFMGFLGYDEVCCLTAEAIEPQKNMPRAILWTMGILSALYVGASLAISGMLPYDEISSVGGFPAAFEARGAAWAGLAAAAGELLTLPLVVLVAVLAQPRLQFALACDGLLPPWFGRADGSGNLRNGTLFSGAVMTLVAGFVPLEYLSDLITAGVLVAFSLTNSSLLLLRHESPDEAPGLLEKSLAWFNAGCFCSSMFLTHVCSSFLGKMATGLCCLVTLSMCLFIQYRCPPATHFGGKTRRATTQHMTVGVVSVEDEYFRTPLLPYVPCLGIFVNWYLVAQLPWSALALLAAFLSCAVLFYFAFGYHYSVGNNGGWDVYDSCGLSIHCDSVHSQNQRMADDDGYRIAVTSVDEGTDAEPDDTSLRSNRDDAQGLPIDDFE